MSIFKLKMPKAKITYSRLDTASGYAVSSLQGGRQTDATIGKQ